MMTPSGSLDKISVFEYTDYRRYLSDYYRFQKSHNNRILKVDYHIRAYTKKEIFH